MGGETGGKLIGLIRVSTGQQGESGLGLEAQEASIVGYAARTGATLMVVEEHTRYHAELAEGERYRVLARLVGHSAKKLHYLLAMESLDREVLAATHEELALHVDLAARRSSPLPADAVAAVEALEAAQADLPPPPDLGRVITA